MSLRTRRARERRERLFAGLGHTAKWLLFFASLAGVALFATHTAREEARDELERLAADRDTARGEAQARTAEAERLARETKPPARRPPPPAPATRRRCRPGAWLRCWPRCAPGWKPACRKTAWPR